MASAIGSLASPKPRTILAASPIDCSVRELVVGKARQPVGQQVPLDACQRSDALGIGEKAAVALRNGLALGEKSLHGDVDVAELACHPGSTADDPPRLDHPAAEAGAHDRRDRGALRSLAPEVHVMSVQSSGIAVVVVDDGKAEPALECAAEVEPAPCRLGRSWSSPSRR